MKMKHPFLQCGKHQVVSKNKNEAHINSLMLSTLLNDFHPFKKKLIYLKGRVTQSKGWGGEVQREFP